MKALWISLCVTLIIAFVEAQSKLSLSKPIISLEKRPQSPTWHRPPEERRKLTIFPRNNKKFVVTERPIPKNRVTATPAISTKRPVMRKLAVQDRIEKETWSVVPREPLMKPKRFTIPIVSETRIKDNIRNFKVKKDDVVTEESKIRTVISKAKKENPVNKVNINKGNLIQVFNSKAKINEQVKVVEKDILSKQVNHVIRNDDIPIVNLPNNAFEEYEMDESELDSTEANNTSTKINEHVNKPTEKLFVSKQVNNVVHNNDSLKVNSREVFEDSESDNIDSDYNDANFTTANNYEQVDKVYERVSLSKQLNNVIKSNDSIKVTSSDKISEDYSIDESDLNIGDAKEAENLEDNQNKSIQHTTPSPLHIEEPLSDVIESRSLDVNDLEINVNKHLNLNNKQRYSEKIPNSSNFSNLQILMTAIANNAGDFSTNTHLINSNDAESLAVTIQNINEETTKGRPKDIDEKMLSIKDENKYNTGDTSVKAYVPEASRKIQFVNTENAANTNMDSINSDIRKSLESLIETIKSNSILADNDKSKSFIGDSELLNLDLNIVEGDIDKLDRIKTESDKITLEPTLNDVLTEAPIEIIFDNIGKLNTEEISKKSTLIQSVSEIIKEPVTDHSNLTKTVVLNIDDSAIVVPQKIENGHRNILNEINNFDLETKYNENNVKSAIINNSEDVIEGIKSNFTTAENSETLVRDSQLLNHDLNVVEHYTDNPDTITIESNKPSQESNLNIGFLTESPIEIIYDNVKPIGTEEISDGLSLNVSTETITDKTMTDEIKSTAEVMSNEAVTSIVTSEDISDEWLVDRSNIFEEFSTKPIIEKLNNLTNEQVFQDSKMVDEETSNQAVVDDLSIINIEISTNTETYEETSYGMTADKEINLKKELSNESLISIENSIGVAKKEEMSDESITVKSNNLKDELPNETFILIDNSSGITKDESSDDPIADKSNILKEELSNESFMLIENSSGGIEKEEISEEQIAEKSNNSKDELSNESSMIIENSSGVVTKEEMSHEIIADKINHSKDELSNESFMLITNSRGVVEKEELSDEPVTSESFILINNSSGIVVKEEMSDKTIADNSNNLKDELSNESFILIDNPSGIVTTEEMSDESIADKSNNLKDEFTNESFISIENSSGVVANEEMSDKSNNSNYEVSNEFFIATDNSSDIITKEKMSDETMADKSNNLKNELSNESFILIDNTSGIVTMEEMSNEMLADKSNNLKDEFENDFFVSNENSNGVVSTEEVSDEKMADKSNNFNDAVSSEYFIAIDNSSVIIIREKMLDETIADKSNNLKDELSNESFILIDNTSGIVTLEEMSEEILADKSNNLKDEFANDFFVSNENSSGVVSTEEMSDEKIADKSNNFNDAVSSEYFTVIENSSDIITKEQMSVEKSADKSDNLTDELSNESFIVIENPSAIVAKDEMSHEIITDKSSNLKEEFSHESLMLFDNSSGIVTTEEMSDQTIPEKPNNFTDDNSNESLIEEVIEGDLSSGNLTGEEILDEFKNEQSNDLTGEDDISNEPIIDVRRPSGELASNEAFIKRIKRSNNIIEEEYTATTVSGFKYTGHGTGLSHDLSFKNINS